MTSRNGTSVDLVYRRKTKVRFVAPKQDEKHRGVFLRRSFLTVLLRRAIWPWYYSSSILVEYEFLNPTVTISPIPSHLQRCNHCKSADKHLINFYLLLKGAALQKQTIHCRLESRNILDDSHSPTGRIIMTPSSFPYNDVGMHQHHYQQPHDVGLHQEWNKIRVERQKLALLQQRLELEEEMLKNEKRNFRRNSKLKKHAARDDQSIGSSSAKIHESPDATKTTVDENSLLVLELREQLKEAEEKLKTQQSFQDELQNVHAQLAATQRSLTLTILEKDTILQERNDLDNRLKNQPVVRQTSINRCEKCDQQQIKLQRLQDELESLRLKCKDHEVEKEEVGANFVAEMEKLRDEISELRQEKEALESELQSSREVDSERLQEQLIEQSKQLDDCKLMISRGKVLLEDANAKSNRLQTRCTDLESKNEEQQELLDNLQSNKAELEQKHEKLEQEYRSLKEQHGSQQLQSSNHSIVSDLSDEGEGTGTLTGNSTQSNSPIIIPLDDGPVSSKLIRSGMKHVVEWEWTNRKGVLGLFTGWLDLTGNPNGHGTWRIEDGSIYDGEWKRGLRNGESTCCLHVGLNILV